MPEYSRIFDEARQRQGFKSQAHLDAFFSAYDHSATCPVCSKESGGVLLDDGWQPTMGRCEEGRRLDEISFRF